jgi:hypothetical protein
LYFIKFISRTVAEYKGRPAVYQDQEPVTEVREVNGFLALASQTGYRTIQVTHRLDSLDFSATTRIDPCVSYPHPALGSATPPRREQEPGSGSVAWPYRFRIAKSQIRLFALGWSEAVRQG